MKFLIKIINNNIIKKRYYVYQDYCKIQRATLEIPEGWASETTRGHSPI